MNAHSDRYFAAEVHRLSAVCRLMRGATGEAVELLQTALDVARSQGAKMFELRAALALAAHDPEKAREVVAAVLVSLPESEPWPDIVRATGLLARNDRKRLGCRDATKALFSDAVAALLTQLFGREA